MSEIVYKQILTREISTSKKVNFHREGLASETRYGFVMCKHDVKVCFFRKYFGCRQCIKENTFVLTTDKLKELKSKLDN